MTRCRRHCPLPPRTWRPTVVVASAIHGLRKALKADAVLRFTGHVRLIVSWNGRILNVNGRSFSLPSRLRPLIDVDVPYRVYVAPDVNTVVAIEPDGIAADLRATR